VRKIELLKAQKPLQNDVLSLENVISNCMCPCWTKVTSFVPSLPLDTLPSRVECEFHFGVLVPSKLPPHTSASGCATWNGSPQGNRNIPFLIFIKYFHPHSMTRLTRELKETFRILKQPVRRKIEFIEDHARLLLFTLPFSPF
jgi:hypothetical protein